MAQDSPGHRSLNGTQEEVAMGLCCLGVSQEPAGPQLEFKRPVLVGSQGRGGGGGDVFYRTVQPSEKHFSGEAEHVSLSLFPQTLHFLYTNEVGEGESGKNACKGSMTPPWTQHYPSYSSWFSVALGCEISEHTHSFKKHD